ncbi:MAG TPA: c-type cytochrome [Chromatiaceae bacterium]|nr:c-type cytochrome [Chromatiaceae bacterium]
MSKKRSIWSALGLIVLGVVLWGGFNTVMEATNTLSFCISCHEMHDNVYQEYKTSVHFSNPSGVQAACPDCHVPKEWIPKVIRKIQASNEVYHWLKGTIDTREKFEARRPQLAEHVWKVMKATDSRECRNCHNFSVMDLKGQARFAARIHKDAMDEGKTCIDCHKGIAHHLPQTLTAKAGLPDFDPEDAEDIMEICAACHGVYAQGTPDGEYPRLAGMNPAYLARQLEHFKNRKRINIPMIPFANDRELPAKDVATITAYLASIDLPAHISVIGEDAANKKDFDALGRLEESKKSLNIPHFPGNARAGGRLYRKECATCHGKKGEGNRVLSVPLLTGQHSKYLLQQIDRFRKGKRVHDDPRDQQIFQQFSDAEISDILAWLSYQDD